MAVTESEVINKSAALDILRAGRAKEANAAPTAQADKNQPNHVSDAARTLGQRAAEARAAKALQTQDPPVKSAQASPAQTEQPENDETTDEASEQSEDHGAEEDQTGAEGETDDPNAQGWPSIEIEGEKYTPQQLKDSILRQADYTRKTQALAERNRVLDSAIGGVTQSRQRLDQLTSTLVNAIGQEPDWVMLASQIPPQQLMVQKETWNQQQRALQGVLQQSAAAAENAINNAKVAMFEEAARTFKPEWSDPIKRQDDVKALADFAISRGIHPEELKMLHRTPMLQILNDAYELQQMRAKQRLTDKRVQGKPKPLRPGVQRNRASASEVQFQTAKQNWESNRSPSVKDALRYLNERKQYQGG